MNQPVEVSSDGAKALLLKTKFHASEIGFEDHDFDFKIEDVERPKVAA